MLRTLDFSTSDDDPVPFGQWQHLVTGSQSHDHMVENLGLDGVLCFHGAGTAFAQAPAAAIAAAAAAAK